MLFLSEHLLICVLYAETVNVCDNSFDQNNAKLPLVSFDQMSSLCTFWC